MRITAQTTRSTYLRHLERNYENKFNSEQKIASFRQWQEASECPATAAHAMRVRKAMANLNTYKNNLQTAENIYSSAESSVMAISEIIQTTYEKCIEAANGTSSTVHTHDPDQLEMLATSVDAFADEISRLMNLEVADRRIFGGINNDSVCFNIQNLGEGAETRKVVTYNGVAVDTYDDPEMFPQSKSSYVDIGLGMYIGDDGRIDEQSAMELTFNGCEITGCGKKATSAFIEVSNQDIDNGSTYTFELAVGTKKLNVSFTGGADKDANVQAINDAIDDALANSADFGASWVGKIKILEHGLITNTQNNETIKIVDKPGAGDSSLTVENQGNAYSNNIIQSILDAADLIRQGNGQEIARYADHIYSLQTKVSLSLAKIGNTTKFIEFNQNRITNNLESMTKLQDELESTDLEGESTNKTLLESIYSANLQMSTSAIPMSIFNFMS
ncbi:MAG: hypothetical protein NC203_08675 [Firmicutes bacterium]|nr:hypothetical protein [[Eubacterium] siraeum]MCM1488426.1 hypothetical protein [Bacillota bacterium]